MIIIQNLVRIDKSLPEPVYQQLSNGIAGIIREGLLQPGSPLPSSRKLAEVFGVHRKTVIAAFDELQAMGWAESYPRKGLFVATRLPITKARTVAPAQKSAPANYPAETSFPVEARVYLYDHPFIAKRERLVFNDGFPDTRLAPVELLIREYRRFSNYRFTAKFLSYGPAQGSDNLRNELARFLNYTRGLTVSPANILITKGVQMAMYLVSQVLLKKGDEVIVGEPGYLGASEVFRAAGATLNFVPVDEDGLDVDAIEQVCKTKKVRLVFVIPHHHTPTTVTLCAERRRQLVDLARKYQFAVLEDDYDFEFHYSSSPILPLASADYCGNVIYVGSFCKTIAPAIRIGFMVAPVNLIEQATMLRKLVDRQGEQLMEEAMANLLRNGDIDRHLKKAGKIYHARRDLLCSLLDKHLRDKVEFRVPDGGFAVWTRFTGGVTTKTVAANAQRLGLSISDGEDYWHLKNGPRNGVRLGFASLNEKEMEEAVGILKKAVAAVTLLLFLFLGGCTGGGKSVSPIEIVRLDSGLVKEIRGKYDSTYTETHPHGDWYYVEHYVTGLSSENVIARDSLRQILAIMRRRNGRNYFAEEYYPNGQSKGKVTLNANGDVDGPVKYYYEDGRVRCTGQYANALKMVGEWKNYDRNGVLTSVDYYSADGTFERRDTISK